MCPEFDELLSEDDASLLEIMWFFILQPYGNDYGGKQTTVLYMAPKRNTEKPSRLVAQTMSNCRK